MRAGTIYDSQIVGVYYAQSGKILASPQEFTELELQPDPQNPVDNKAVKIMYQGAHLGFVPKVINKIIFSAITTGKNVLCLMQRYIPAVERNNEFSPERASITIHIIHPVRFQKIFTHLMDIYGLTYPNLPPNWGQAMVALGEVGVSFLEPQIPDVSDLPIQDHPTASQEFIDGVSSLVTRLTTMYIFGMSRWKNDGIAASYHQLYQDLTNVEEHLAPFTDRYSVMVLDALQKFHQKLIYYHSSYNRTSDFRLPIVLGRDIAKFEEPETEDAENRKKWLTHSINDPNR